MNITDQLRGRFRPEWKQRADMTGLDNMLETALSFVGAAAVKRDKLAASGTLTDKGVAESLRADLEAGVLPQLQRIKKTITDRRAALVQERDSLAKPKIDPTDMAAAMRRQEIRAWLRGMSQGERLMALSGNGVDGETLAAALELPTLSGLTAEMRGRVIEMYLQTNHRDALRGFDEREEALNVVDAAAGVAIMAMKPHVGLDDHGFHAWFGAAA